jgi:hypothetical protein
LAGCGGGGGGGPPPDLTPRANEGTTTGDEDTVLAGQVLASDPGDTLTYAVTTGTAVGTLSALDSTGHFSYTPPPNFNGAESFVFRVTDRAGHSASATQHLQVTPVNDPPEAHDDILTVNQPAPIQLNVLANDVDIDGDALSIRIIEAPLVGTLSTSASGVGLTVPGDFAGVTRFRYEVTDAGGVTARATAVVFVGIPAFRVLVNGMPSANGTPGLYLSDMISARRVDDHSAGFMDDVQVAANGTAVAYRVRDFLAPTAHVYYAPLDHAAAVRQIDATPVGADIPSFVLSPDGRYVAFQVTDTRPSSSIWLWDAEGSNAAIQVSPGTAPLLYVDPPQFSALSNAVYFHQYGSTGQIPNAIYRVAVSAPATAVRVTKDLGTTGGTSGFLLANNGSSIISYGGRDPLVSSTDIYINSAAQPDTEARLNVPVNWSGDYNLPTAAAALLTPDQQYLIYTVPDTTDNIRVIRTPLAAPGTRVTLGTLPGHAVPRFLRADGSALAMQEVAFDPATFKPGLHEVNFANPATESQISPNLPDGTSISPLRYSVNDTGVLYIQTDPSPTPGAFQPVYLAEARPGASGPVVITPIDRYLERVDFDPKGAVAGIALATDDSLWLVNIRAPQVLMPIPGLSTASAGRTWLLPR